MHEKTVILIQARSSSTRLLGKYKLPLPPDNNSIVEQCYYRLSKTGIAVYFVVPSDDIEIINYLENKKLPFLTGEHDDVRKRYIDAATALKAEIILRATADNPCVDIEAAAKTAIEMQKGYDLFSFTGLPLGCAVEAFRLDALNNFTDEYDDYKEHVSLHIKHRPEYYSVHHEPFHSVQFDKPVRLTVDVQEDYNLVYALFSKLGSDFSLKDIVDLYKKDPDFFNHNGHVRQRTFEATNYSRG